MKQERKTFEEVFEELTAEETITVNAAGETIITTPDGISVYVDYAPAPAARQKQNVAEKPLMKCYTWGDICDIEFPPLKWAVNGLLPAGLTILAGSAKMGKSFLALNIAVGIATGTQALDIPVDFGSVLYLALEDGQRRMRDRIDAMGLSQHHRDKCRDTLYIVHECPRQNEGGIAALNQWITTHTDVRLVIIDTLQVFRTPTSPRADRYAADYETLRELKQLADKYDIPLLIIHHTNKRTDADWLNDVSGSMGITGSADTILVLKRSRCEQQAILHRTSRDIGEADLSLRRDGALWHLLGDARDYELQEGNKQVLECIRNGLTSAKEIAEELGIARNTADQKLYRMMKNGLIQKTDRGKFIVVEV